MTTSDLHGRPGEPKTRETSFGRAEQRATIVGSIAGGLAGVGGFYAGMAPQQWLYLRYVAIALGIGPGSRTQGVIAFFALAAVFGAVFGVFVARYGDAIVRGLAAGAGSNPVTRLFLAPAFGRLPLATTTTVVGSVYGVLLGLTVGHIAVPSIVVGATPIAFELTQSEPGILIGFVAYGTALGLGYGLSRERALPRPSLGGFDDLTQALLFGPVAGTLAGAGVLYVFARGHLASLALIADPMLPSALPLAVWAAVGLVLALPFLLVGPKLVSRGSGYVSGVTAAGVAYGLLLAVVVGAIAVPHFSSRLAGSPTAAPNVRLGTTLGYLTYGTFLGAVYATCRQYGRAFPKAVSDHRDAVIFSALVGGGIGGGIVHAAGRTQLLSYGAVVHAPDSVPRSWAVWMTLSVLLGVGYVAVVRPRDTGPGYIWRSARRGTVFGLASGFVLGPALVPVAVDGTIPSVGAVTSLDPLVLVGYTVLGTVVGLGYGASVEADGLATDAERTTAVGFGSLLGGFTGGLVVHHVAGPLHIQHVGALVGVAESIAKSWALWLALALLLGVGFASIVSRSLSAYAATVTRSVERHPHLNTVVAPVLGRAPLTATGAGIGLMYGAVAGVVVGALLLPMTVSWFIPHHHVPVPSVEPGVFLGYTVYGLFLGTGYGALIEF